MYTGLHVKYMLFSADFNETWIFPADFWKKAQISNFKNMRPVDAELFHADGRTDRETDMSKVIVAFRNFANAPKTKVSYRI